MADRSVPHWPTGAEPTLLWKAKSPPLAAPVRCGRFAVVPFLETPDARTSALAVCVAFLSASQV